MEKLIFQSVIGFLDSLKMHYLLIPGEILTKLNKGEEKGKFSQRVLVKVNQSVEWQGGIVALTDGDGYITFSKARMKSINVLLDDKIEIELIKDTSEFGHVFPLELDEYFKQDELAKNRFGKMSPGKQRTIIYYINQAKSSDKKLERVILYMQNLKNCPEGKETMSVLMKK